MKAFFVDLTLCTACRGCQVACKQWKNLPAEETKNWGSHQNPKDLSGDTYKLVRFTELQPKGKEKIDWIFFPEQCRHCIDPPCYYAAEDVEGAILHDEGTGAVVFTDKTKTADFAYIRDSCPYDIPRQNKDNEAVKCDMCLDRVQDGKLPACVLTCPTGAMSFGEEADIRTMAENRLKEVQARYPEAELGDIDSVRVIYLFPYAPNDIFAKAVAAVQPNDTPFSRRELFAKLGKRAKRA